MESVYVERREAGLYLTGSRVPLDCILREYQLGESPEAIRTHFPTLSLEQVYGAITYHLAHEEEVELAIREHERVEDDYSASHPAPVQLKEKLDHFRQRTLAQQK